MFIEEHAIDINDLHINESCYVEYERHGDILIEKAVKTEEGDIKTIRHNKLVKDYSALYPEKGD